MLRLMFAVLLLSLFGTSAHAERRVALVIGNSAYVDAPVLRNPRNDAEDVGKALTSLGFEVTTGRDLTGLQLTRMIAAFSRSLQGADVALFYYAGHGIQANDQNYLIPVDAHVEDEFGLKREGVALADVISEMEGRAKTSLVFLDACRDSPFVERLKRSMTGNRSASVGRGLARIGLETRDTLLVYATAPGQVAADGVGRNSPFTTAFLQHVAAPGVEIESVMKRVTASVRSLTRGAQEPERLSRLSTEFYFAKAPEPVVIREPAPSPPADDAAKAFEVAKSIGSVAAWDAFLQAFPTGVYANFAKDLKADLVRKAALVPTETPAVKPAPAEPAKPPLETAKPLVEPAKPPVEVVKTEPPPTPEKPASLAPENAAPPVVVAPVVMKPNFRVRPVVRRPARIVRSRPAPSGGGACFVVDGRRVCN